MHASRATEFVISTELNGAKGRIYMSREHYMELARQLEFFKKETGKSLKTMAASLLGVERQIREIGKLNNLNRLG